jgi:hypothetical protein
VLKERVLTSSKAPQGRTKRKAVIYINERENRDESERERRDALITKTETNKKKKK